MKNTYNDFEVVLVNDGSKDKTESIIKKYDDSRIVYFKNDNQGIGKTRNFGIDKSKGDYLMFIDSDDYIEKNALELLVKKIEEDNLDIVVCDFYRKYPKKVKKEKLDSFENTSIKEDEDLLIKINLSPWNKIYRKKLIDKNNIRFSENLKYEDTMFVLEALIKANKIGKVDEYLNYYVIHDNSETTVMNEKVFDILTIYKDIYRKYGKKYKNTINKLTVKMLTNYTIQQRYQKDKSLREKFINDVFDFFEKEIPDYKRNLYYKDRGFLRRTIEKSRKLSLMYCNIYAKFKNKNNKNNEKAKKWK